MAILGVVLIVFFVIIAVLLILLVLIQNEEGDGLGGIFGGGSSTTFGSRSGNVLTRATTILGSLFLIISLGLAFLSRSPGISGIEEEGRRQSIEAEGSGWVDEALNPSTDSSIQSDIFNLDDISFDDFEINFNTEDTEEQH